MRGLIVSAVLMLLQWRDDGAGGRGFEGRFSRPASTSASTPNNAIKLSRLTLSILGLKLKTDMLTTAAPHKILRTLRRWKSDIGKEFLRLRTINPNLGKRTRANQILGNWRLSSLADAVNS